MISFYEQLLVEVNRIVSLNVFIRIVQDVRGAKGFGFGGGACPEWWKRVNAKMMLLRDVPFPVDQSYNSVILIGEELVTLVVGMLDVECLLLSRKNLVVLHKSPHFQMGEVCGQRIVVEYGVVDDQIEIKIDVREVSVAEGIKWAEEERRLLLGEAPVTD